jgi:formylglycine-generating enzyme required for sulfatase activity
MLLVAIGVAGLALAEPDGRLTHLIRAASRVVNLTGTHCALWIVTGLCGVVGLSDAIPFHGGFFVGHQAYVLGWRTMVFSAASLIFVTFYLFVPFASRRADEDATSLLKRFVIYWLGAIVLGMLMHADDPWSTLSLIAVAGFCVVRGGLLARMMARNRSFSAFLTGNNVKQAGSWFNTEIFSYLSVFLLFTAPPALMALSFPRLWQPIGHALLTGAVLPIHALRSALTSFHPLVSTAVMVLLFAVVTGRQTVFQRCLRGSLLLLTSLLITFTLNAVRLPGSLSYSPEKEPTLTYRMDGLMEIVDQALERETPNWPALRRASRAVRRFPVRERAPFESVFAQVMATTAPMLLQPSQKRNTRQAALLAEFARNIETPRKLHEAWSNVVGLEPFMDGVTPELIDSIALDAGRLGDAFGWRIALLERLSGVAERRQWPDLAAELNARAASAWPSSDHRIPDTSIQTVQIPAGTFQMGSQTGRLNEQPVRLVNITRPYWLGTTEVTHGQYRDMGSASPHRRQITGITPEHPVESVSWDDAMRFCQDLTRREGDAGRIPPGYAYRLPTEAEWEYAARARIPDNYPRDLRELGWFEANSDGRTQPVGEKTPNPRGLYDMHGNVWEWCLDTYADDTLMLQEDNNPVHLVPAETRVRRGGAWSSPGAPLRPSYRDGTRRTDSFHDVGFRICLGPVVEGLGL